MAKQKPTSCITYASSTNAIWFQIHPSQRCQDVYRFSVIAVINDNLHRTFFVLRYDDFTNTHRQNGVSSAGKAAIAAFQLFAGLWFHTFCKHTSVRRAQRRGTAKIVIEKEFSALRFFYRSDGRFWIFKPSAAKIASKRNDLLIAIMTGGGGGSDDGRTDSLSH